jgi:ribonuclease P protein component
MLAKKNRLTAEEVRTVYSKGKSVRHAGFRILWHRSPCPVGAERTVFGLMISKKTVPTSVERHVIKRIISQKLRGVLKDIESSSPHLVEGYAVHIVCELRSAGVTQGRHSKFADVVHSVRAVALGRQE